MWYWTKILFLTLIGAVGVWLIYELVTFPAIGDLRTENPTTTSMIEYRLSEARSEGREPRKFMIWTPIEQISPHLQRAVLAGEDSRLARLWTAQLGLDDDLVPHGDVRSS